MSINIQSPKVTWAAVYCIAGLVFSTGIFWSQVREAIATNETQWRHINKNTGDISHQEVYLSKVDQISQNLAERSKSEKEFTASVVKLTYAIDNIFQRTEMDRDSREKSDKFMMDLSAKINNIEVKIGKIEEKLTK